VAVPLLHEGNPIGAIAVARAKTGSFPNRQIVLLQAFADQAVSTRSRKATLVGIGQASAAAAGAAGVARSLINGEVKSGAWMPEQIIEPTPFFSRLRAQGLNLEFGPDT
jgi:GAF domain-containing protein